MWGRSVPHYVIYASSAPFRNLYVSSISNRHLHIQSISKPNIFSLLNVSCNHLCCPLFTIMAAEVCRGWLTWKTLEGCESVKRMGESIVYKGRHGMVRCRLPQHKPGLEFMHMAGLCLHSVRVSRVCADVPARQLKRELVDHLAFAWREQFTNLSVYGALGVSEQMPGGFFFCILTQISFIWLVWQKPVQPIFRTQWIAVYIWLWPEE